MKIAVLHSGDLQEVSLGGVDRYIKSLILFAENNEITVFGTTVVGKEEIGKPVKRNYCGKEYTFVPISDNRRRPLSVYYMLNEMKWVAELGKFDCIYAQRTEYSIPFLFSRNKKKLIQMIHGSSKYSEVGFGKKLAFFHLIMEKIAISIAKYTFIILNRPEFGVPYYQEKYPKYKNRIYYGKNPIDPRIFCKQDKNLVREKYGIDQSDFIVLFCGRVENNPKRVLLLPYICKRLLENGCKAKFLIVGDGTDKAALEQLVEELALKDYFIFTGYENDPYVIAEYNNIADVAINISIFEGTCTSVLESLACGTPVISTDVGDIHECLYDGYNGSIICNDENAIVEEAANEINRIQKNEIQMDDVYMKYSGDHVIEELKEFVRKL